MNITSAQFVKGLVGPDELLEENVPQIAFIGRSNVGKSSLINSLTNQKKIARTSGRPGRTQEINLFLVNDCCYFLDLPGYGYARASKETRSRLQAIIHGYLFNSPYIQEKIVMVIDANLGLRENDLEMLNLLDEHEKDIVIVANKVDKIKKSKYKNQIDSIKEQIGSHRMIPYSVKKRIGRDELINEILQFSEVTSEE